MSFFGESNDNNSRYESKTDLFGGRKEKDDKSSHNPWFQLPIKVRIVICLFAGLCLFILFVSAYNEINSAFSFRSRESEFGNFNERTVKANFDPKDRHYVSQKEGFFSSLFCNGIQKPGFCKD